MISSPQTKHPVYSFPMVDLRCGGSCRGDVNNTLLSLSHRNPILDTPLQSQIIHCNPM